jgi:hypothetical protein
MKVGYKFIAKFQEASIEVKFEDVRSYKQSTD